PQMDRRDHLQHVVVVPGDIGNDDGRRDAPGQRDRDEPPATRFWRWWSQEQPALLRDFPPARAHVGIRESDVERTRVRLEAERAVASVPHLRPAQEVGGLTD